MKTASLTDNQITLSFKTNVVVSHTEIYPLVRSIWNLAKVHTNVVLAMGLVSNISVKGKNGIIDALSVVHLTVVTILAKKYDKVRNIPNEIKSWLHHFDIEVKRRIKIANVDATPTLADERVPDATELKELFNRANLRTGAIMALIAKAGLRPEVLGNHDATDGLMIRDLPELEVISGSVRFTRMPPKVIVRKTLSKARHVYFTFVTETGAEKILAYLNERMLSGETLVPESSVISPSTKLVTYQGKNQGKKFMSTARIEHEVRKAMRPRFKWRPYVLRAYFDTQLLIAESRGKMAMTFVFSLWDTLVP